MNNSIDDIYEDVRAMRKLTTIHPNFKKAYSKMKEALRANMKFGIQLNALILGYSGTGKSRLCEAILHTHPPEKHQDRVITPVIVVPIPAEPTVKNVAEAVLLALGDPSFYRGSAMEKTQRAVLLAKKKNVHLFIFDEVQHFVDCASNRVREAVTNWFKSFINASDASVFLVGLHRTDELLMGNEQLKRRFSRRIEIAPLALQSKNSNDSDTTFEFRDTFLSFLDVIKRPTNANLFKDSKLVSALYHSTYGIPGYMANLLEGALINVAGTSDDFMSYQNLEKTFTEQIWHQGTGSDNPFNQAFEGWDLKGGAKLPPFVYAENRPEHASR